MSKSKIEWTDATWNVTGGCTPVSAGCLNCAAARQVRRCNGYGNDKYKGLVDGAKWTGEIRLYPEELKKPLHWRQPRLVFVDFMSDLFHPDVPFDFIDKVFAVMALCPQHTFQVLTKRPERMVEYLSNYLLRVKFMQAIAAEMKLPHNDFMYTPEKTGVYNFTIPLPNVWVGITTENQAMADLRIPELLKCPAAKRFVSIEPMLGLVDLSKYITLQYGKSPDCCNVRACCGDCNLYPCIAKPNEIQIDWVICGGESGPGARPMHPDWARSIRDQCKAAGVPFFFKQWGAWLPGSQANHISDSELSKYKFQNLRPVGGQCFTFKVGKKKAGSTLDGIEHKEMPEGVGR